ncbi:MAG: buk2 4 [Firmicutes bacterium]|nr:buk2 4 [Bacillota bacterium]
MYKILTINPGSTSTKIGLFQDTTEVFVQSITHSAEDIAKFPAVIDQFAYRLENIENFLSKQNISVNNLSAIVARGGLLKPMVSGTYQINAAMLDDLKHSRYGAHASNLGALLADKLAAEGRCNAYIVDPVVVDELAPIARLSGRPELTRKSIFHALNHKAVAKRFAKTVNRSYENLNLIIAHLGGGISVACHTLGQAVEVNNCLNGEGPFSPERAGTLPYLGTTDVREVERRIADGDKQAELVYNAMIYTIAKSIGAAAIPVCGKVDYIILTGGIAYSEQLTAKLKEYVSFIAPVVILPGENELQALAEGAYRVLIGEETAKEYQL